MGLDRDPVALLLGAVAVLLAIAYLVAALRGARPVVRGAIVGVAAVALVVAPTAAFVAMGVATSRPYGQDGGVVQLPLAMDRILAGESPYGADYSDSILGKEARVSDFWSAHGGNPILRHHAYLPGTHLLMMAPYLASRALGAAFDPRLVTLLAYGLAILLAAGLVADPSLRLVAAAVAAVNPLVYWHQVFGANDLMVAALVLLAVFLASTRRPGLAAAVLGLACGTKQLAWPYAPFLLVHLASLRSLGDLASRDGLRRLARPVLIASAVFLAVVAPVVVLDFPRFWGDIVAYNVGLPGRDNYPLGGTPGFGFANFVIYGGYVSSLKDYFPFGVFYALLLPLGLFLLHRQVREGSTGSVLVTGSAALLAFLYFSRVVHPNYLILPAILLPVGVLMGARVAADVVAAPLLLFSLAAEVSDHEVFRTVWEDGLSVRLPQHLSGAAAAFAPRAGPGLTPDPLGLAFSATAAGIAVAYLVGGLAGLSARARQALIAAGVLALVVVPTIVVVNVGRATGQPRGQDPWLASFAQQPRPALQAWSTSFRRDPPGRLAADGALFSPAARFLGHPGLGDPRWVSLVAMALAAGLMVRLVPPEGRPLAVGAALLSPPAAVGVIFGAPDMLLLAAALGAWALGRRGFPAVAAVVAATLLLFVVLPFAADAVEPGLGLPNAVLYWGFEAPVLVNASAWAAGLVGIALWWRLRGSAAFAAIVLLTVLFAANGVSPHSLAVPLVLLLLSLLVSSPRGAREFE